MDCISCHPEGENHMQELKLKRVYRHFKGDYYLVEDVAKDSETGEEYVVYGLGITFINRCSQGIWQRKSSGLCRI